MINNKNITLVWRVDDLKVSHVNIFEIAKFSGCMSRIYGVITVYRAKLHGYLGVVLYCSKQETVKVFIINDLDSLLQELPENLGANAATPQYDHLFKISNESETQYLPED